MSDEQTASIQYALGLIDERPICLWDFDILGRNLEFLNSVDPTYYSYMASVHFDTIRQAEQEEQGIREIQHGALAIRTTYAQALETLFAFLCAAIQAPFCVPVWISSYLSPELYKVVEKIQKHQRVDSVLDTEVVTWSEVADYILKGFRLEDVEKREATVQAFAQLWQHLAYEFLEENARREYNSIKHGLRIRSGGFSFAIGPQDKPGVQAPKKKMVSLGSSKYGTSYMVPEKVDNLRHHFFLLRHSRNWNPEDMGWSLNLIALSLNNIQCALKRLNGSKEELEFLYPQDLTVIEEAWKRSRQVGVTSLKGFGTHISKSYIQPYSAEEITSYYNAMRLIGVHEIDLREDSSARQ